MTALRAVALAASVALGAAACGSSPSGGGGSRATRPGAGPTPSALGPSVPPPTSPPTQAPTGPAGTGTAGTGPAGSANWTTYQGSADHAGRAAPQPELAPIRPAWSARLDGAAVYGQPLYFDGRVIVATEDDHVYALDAATGRPYWSVSLGRPLRDVAAAAGCGDVDPLGVTSTPVIDPATGTVYVLGEVSTAGGPPVHHQLVGIDIRTGRTTLSVDADPPLPPGESPVQLLQRAALALGNGRVYIGYGGQYGDCGTYHGWLVAVPTGSPSRRESFDVTPDATGGAIWDGGSGPVTGPDGSVYVTTGNPTSAGPAPWAEAVLKLRPDLTGAPEAVFRDRAATGDLDLATGGPMLLPGGTVFAAGKTDIGYLLRASDLGLVSTVRGRICGSDPDGGAAVDPSTGDLYLPCQGGAIQQVRLGGPATGWLSGGANSTPVLAGGGLWALNYLDGTLREIDPATGRVLDRLAVGRPLPHFASLSVAGGLLLVPTASGVEAFR